MTDEEIDRLRLAYADGYAAASVGRFGSIEIGQDLAKRRYPKTKTVPREMTVDGVRFRMGPYGNNGARVIQGRFADIWTDARYPTLERLRQLRPLIDQPDEEITE